MKLFRRRPAERPIVEEKVAIGTQIASLPKWEQQDCPKCGWDGPARIWYCAGFWVEGQPVGYVLEVNCSRCRYLFGIYRPLDVIPTTERRCLEMEAAQRRADKVEREADGNGIARVYLDTGRGIGIAARPDVDERWVATEKEIVRISPLKALGLANALMTNALRQLDPRREAEWE